MNKMQRVDFDKWIDELEGDEKTAWLAATTQQKSKIRGASNRLNKLPVWSSVGGWVVGPEFFGKDVSGGRRRKTKKSKRRSRKTRRYR
jgi:hypothetical protein